MVFIASSWFPVDGRRGGTGIGLNHWCDWYYVEGLVLIGAREGAGRQLEREQAGN